MKGKKRAIILKNWYFYPQVFSKFLILISHACFVETWLDNMSSSKIIIVKIIQTIKNRYEDKRESLKHYKNNKYVENETANLTYQNASFK